MRRPKLVGLCVCCAVLGAACNDDGRTLRDAKPSQNESISVPSNPAPDAGDEPEVSLEVTRPPRVGVIGPWLADGPIPATYTCDGANTSPSLTWGEPDLEVAEIAITVTDDQAPDFVHWALVGLDSSATAMAEDDIPETVIEGTNGYGQLGYTGPCPPVGETHTYRYTIHFLERPIDALQGVPGTDLVAEIQDAELDSIELVGTYTRPPGATNPVLSTSPTSPSSPTTP